MASTEQMAEKVGRAWCQQSSNGLLEGYRYVSVRDPVLADESILTKTAEQIPA